MFKNSYLLPIVCFFFSHLVSQSVFAEKKEGVSFVKNNDKDAQCILLGSKPSFIVQFKKNALPASVQNTLPKRLKAAGAGMSAADLMFSSIRPMSGGAHILTFMPQIQAMTMGEEKKETLHSMACFSKETVNQWVSQIKQSPNVEVVTPNLLLSPSSSLSTSAPPTPDTSQWNLLTPHGGINVQAGWGITMGNPEAVVAVLDTGYVPHEALKPNLHPGVQFTNNGEYSNSGFPSCVPGHNGLPNDPDICSGYFHGNHVAGIVASSGVLAYQDQIYGVAPKIKFLPVNVFSKIEDQEVCDQMSRKVPCSTAYLADIINGLNWLSGAHFSGLPSAPSAVVGVNMSLGGGMPCDELEPMIDAFSRLEKKQITVAVAAGNEGSDAINVTPASCPYVISVAATGVSGFRAYYSNYGSTVKIAAPGGNIEEGDYALIYSTGDPAVKPYLYAQGTSMASPHVAGLIGLLYSVDPTLNSEEVLKLIQETATPFPVSGNSEFNCIGEKSCGKGIINVGAAVMKAKTQAAVLSWENAGLSAAPLEDAKQVKLNWLAAQWVPERKAPIAYTVRLDGKPVPYCTHIHSTQCTLKQMDQFPADSVHTVLVEASDVKKLYANPLKSLPVKFKANDPHPPIPAQAPHLVSATRFLFQSLNNVVVPYRNLGTPRCQYSVPGIPSAVVRLRPANKDFLIRSVPLNTKGLRITAHCKSGSAISNRVNIRNSK